MRVTAPAKINLTLRIRGKRPDGYHELESVMQMLALADTLTLDAEEEGIHFTCSDPTLETESNLVVRAAALLRDFCPRARGVRIHLEKAIPQQAGLGGGSSDAAATLSALNELWEIRLTPDELAAQAAKLGSDVPFFLYGPTAVVQGRGERITPAINRAPGHVVLAKPAAGLSTARVYADVHAETLSMEKSHAPLPETRAMLHAMDTGKPSAVAKTLANDLEGPALQLLPELFRIRERMLALGCLGVLLCGSGSALFGLCEDEETAHHAAIDLTNDCPWTWAGPWIPLR